MNDYFDICFEAIIFHSYMNLCCNWYITCIVEEPLWNILKCSLPIESRWIKSVNCCHAPKWVVFPLWISIQKWYLRADFSIFADLYIQDTIDSTCFWYNHFSPFHFKLNAQLNYIPWTKPSKGKGDKIKEHIENRLEQSVRTIK